MPNYNKVILMGNLTRDPEVRYTSSGTAIAKLGMAINRHWRNQDGQQQEETTFVDVDAFGRQAETIGQYLKTGQKRSKMGVTLENFQFLDSRGEGGGNAESGGGNFGGGGAAAPAAGGAAPATGGGGGFAEDDDVPF